MLVAARDRVFVVIDDNKISPNQIGEEGKEDFCHKLSGLLHLRKEVGRNTEVIQGPIKPRLPQLLDDVGSSSDGIRVQSRTLMNKSECE